MAKSADSAAPPTSPTVRLEVRAGANRPTVYDVADGGFLIGSVPGCDLRLPGINLPPVVCLIAPTIAGASLRKLSAVHPVSVNGKTVTATALNTGDRIGLGPVEIVVQFVGEILASPPHSTSPSRKGGVEAQYTPPPYGGGSPNSGGSPNAGSSPDTIQQTEELLAWRRDLDQQRTQMNERFRQKRDKLKKMGDAVRLAAQRVQRRKHEVEAGTSRLEVDRQEVDRRQSVLDASREQFERERSVVEEQHRIIAVRQKELQREIAARLAEVEQRERKYGEECVALEKGQKQHQADLVRLDRLQATLDQRQQQLRDRALEVDRRFEQLQHDSRELEEQAAQLDELRERLTLDAATMELRKKEYEAGAGKADQRAAALESQQAMLAALRTRFERMREDLRRQEQELSAQRVAQQEAEEDLRRRADEARQLHTEVTAEKELFEQERRRFEERRGLLDQAVAQVRQSQDSHSAIEAELQRRQEEIDATAVQQAEQAGILLARGQQIEELHARILADRQNLRDREAALAKAESTLAALQEQLRRRGDELIERDRAVAEQDQKLREQTAAVAARQREWEEQKKLNSDGLDALRLELTSRAAKLDETTLTLNGREEMLRGDRARLEEEFRALEAQRQALQAERVAFETEREAAARRQAEFEAARAEAAAVARQLPELEARATAAAERLSRGREQLREHLAELHGYTRQGREDLEAARKQLHEEAERLRRQEQQQLAVRDEHRHAVTAFRQQLVEWQGHLTEMRQALLHDGSRLERRQAEVEERAQEVDAVRQKLEHQAEELQEAARVVEFKHGEMTRHLSDMREWYRKKMRELSGIDAAAESEPDVVPLPATLAETAGADRGILALTGEGDPGDRKLGDLLRSLELIDAETLAALLLEARRQRRSLRQLLLAGNYLTLYQMALIEAGNLDALVLGPVRVIDRLKATPREATYRVFDPRRNSEALLRHLAEAEMEDAVRPDEFRQRFAAAAHLQHENLSATYEVFDLHGRPAVLQEWLNGLPGSDWPTLTAAPGVWHRLLSQAARALCEVHGAGLVHGHLYPASFVLTGTGVLKLTGLGEPLWLSDDPPNVTTEPTPAADLSALGVSAAMWAGLVPRKAAKTKALPDALLDIVRRLESVDTADCFPSAAALLSALDQAAASVPANATAWERFLKQVREQSEDVALRQTA